MTNKDIRLTLAPELDEIFAAIETRTDEKWVIMIRAAFNLINWHTLAVNIVIDSKIVTSGEAGFILAGQAVLAEVMANMLMLYVGNSEPTNEEKNALTTTMQNDILILTRKNQEYGL